MSGARGRMGQMILSLAGGPEYSRDIEASGQIDLGDDALSQIKGAQVMIDFSSPENSIKMAELCAENSVGFILGTTGLTAEQKSKIEAQKARIPVLISPNMSLGVNLLFYLTEMAARALPNVEAEIVELHHNQKVDGPSGTAIRLKDIVRDVTRVPEEKVVHGRHGLVGKRTSGEIGMHAVRGGDTPGDHTVYFFLEGERLEITHRALSRSVFAHGALRAAMFLAGKPPGLYSMNDVLGIAHV
ncbi:MAG: 4-hydroxy-tetrahydrodipicolinate reductase [Spirochaetia bacterium]|nr:4-hydroxy-tetrahydrodipicolinate reductase [Spirochaetia bacterium]